MNPIDENSNDTCTEAERATRRLRSNLRAGLECPPIEYDQDGCPTDDNLGGFAEWYW